MAASGICLLLTDRLLGWIPLWFIDLAATVHFYKAALACSALVVWHGYWVVRGK
ncbi:MAG: hypothetical protein R6V10_00550 [bacterium]